MITLRQITATVDNQMLPHLTDAALQNYRDYLAKAAASNTTQGDVETIKRLSKAVAAETASREHGA